MKKTITLLLGVLFTTLSLKAQWSEVGGPYGFSAGQAFWLSIDFDGTIPYAAYRDCANGCSPTVMKFNGTAWQNVGSAGITGAGSDYVSLAVVNSVPYIAFADGANSNKLAVMKYTSGSWSYIGTSLSAGAITGASIVADQVNNLLYVSYLASGTGSLSIQKYNLGTQTWSSLSMSLYPALSTNYVGLSIYNGDLYTSASHWSTDTIVVAKRSSATGAWTNIRTHVTGTSPSKIGFDNSGNLYLAYVSFSTGAARGAVLRCIGSAWQQLGAPLSLTSDTIIAPTNGMALAMDNNTPYVAYGNIHNYSKLSVSKYNGSSWQIVGTNDFSLGGSPVDYNSLKIVSSTPYIAYTAYSPIISNLRTYMMKFDISTGLNVYDDTEVSMFPNPVINILHLDFKNTTQHSVIEILDLTGKTILHQTLQSTNAINISEFASGVYIVKVINDGYTSVKRFVKQ